MLSATAPSGSAVMCSGRMPSVTAVPGAARAAHATLPSGVSTAPSARTVPGTKFMSPTNAATNVSTGASYTSSGVPCCRIRPARITQTRSPRLSASIWSCVT